MDAFAAKPKLNGLGRFAGATGKAQVARAVTAFDEGMESLVVELGVELRAAVDLNFKGAVKFFFESKIDDGDLVVGIV